MKWSLSTAVILIRNQAEYLWKMEQSFLLRCFVENRDISTS